MQRDPKNLSPVQPEVLEAPAVTKKWAGLSKADCEALRGVVIVQHGIFHDRQNRAFKSATVYVPVAQAKAAEAALLELFYPKHAAAEREGLLSTNTEHVYDMQLDAMVSYQGFRLTAMQAEEVMKATTPSPKGNRPMIAQARMVGSSEKDDTAALIEALAQEPQAVPTPAVDEPAAKPDKPGKREWVEHHGKHHQRHAPHRR